MLLNLKLLPQEQHPLFSSDSPQREEPCTGGRCSPPSEPSLLTGTEPTDRACCLMTVCWLQLCGGICSVKSVKTPNSWSSWCSTCANRKTLRAS
ncbi:hypothetical protein F7725_016341 [Dissostichus mawsoni]|uniref:Uncharacterized protein n=1 Tax=Dissostichus mawsoni TaxID=36200 RepID=A0A7J5Z5M5_DISMA|nr:hypothetical protein F7725_016341 [Dissostichus mawsoni]